MTSCRIVILASTGALILMLFLDFIINTNIDKWGIIDILTTVFLALKNANNHFLLLMFTFFPLCLKKKCLKTAWHMVWFSLSVLHVGTLVKYFIVLAKRYLSKNTRPWHCLFNNKQQQSCKGLTPQFGTHTCKHPLPCSPPSLQNINAMLNIIMILPFSSICSFNCFILCSKSSLKSKRFYTLWLQVE